MTDEHDHKRRMLAHLTRQRNLRDEIQRVLEVFWEDVQSSSIDDRYLAMQIERVLNDRTLEIPPKGFVSDSGSERRK